MFETSRGNNKSFRVYHLFGNHENIPDKWLVEKKTRLENLDLKFTTYLVRSLYIEK